MKTIRYCSAALALVLLAAGTPAAAQDAALTLSRNADFSTSDREFEEGDVVHVRVTAPEVDPADLEKNELRVYRSNDSGSSQEYRMAFQNNLDGTYTAALDSLSPGSWYLRAIVEDGRGTAFEGDARFTIGSSSTETEIRVEGTITEIGDQFLVVMDRRIFRNPDTEIVDENGGRIEFSALKLGDRVVVEFKVSFSGELIARWIKRLGRDNNEVTLRGRISELGDSWFVVLERMVHVDSSTVIVDEYGQHIRFGALQQGDVVEVKGRVRADGSILALKVQLEDSHENEVEFTGVIQEIGERAIVVGDRRVVVTDETEIIGQDGQSVPFSALSVGMLVHVKALATSPSSTDPNALTALRIKVIEDSRFVVEGEIEELGEAGLVVAGIPFRVVDKTEIVTSTGVKLRFDDLEVGFHVAVFATAVNATNDLVALKIVVLRPSVEVRTITGFLKEIDGDLIVVNDFVIRVVDRTEILNEEGEEIRFSDLEVGMRLRVTAVHFLSTRLDLRVLVAERIRVLPDREKRVVGRIRAVDESHIVIAGIEAQITDDTRIYDRNGEPIAAGDLEVGMLAAVHVVETNSGLVATVIRLLPRLEDEVGVAGVLESVEDSAVVVLGQTFVALPNTVARDVSGTPIPLHELEVGRPVALRGEMLAGGTLVALHIQELAHDVRGIKVLGPVESVFPPTIEVIGIHFFVDSETKIFDLERNEVALGDIGVGQTVIINAEGQPNGTRLAKTIQLLDVAVAAGDIALSPTGEASMFGVQYAVAPDVLVITDDHVSLDAEAIESDMYVEIRGSRVDEDTYTITKIKLLSAASVGTESGEIPATAAQLASENYPNPFSASTTIAFDVPAGGEVRTTLAIYDVTGRHVKTLVDADLQSGRHEAVWDGRDKTGKQVASGLYFYRVQAGAAATARAMTLIK